MKWLSVIIPCYNAEQWIAEAIESAIEQTYKTIEIIVVDDGSSDCSAAIIGGFGDRVLAVSMSHKGGNAARNLGFARASGEYVQFLDADDVLRPQKLERQVSHLERTGTDVAYGDWQHQRHDAAGGVSLEETHVSGEQGDMLAALLEGWWVAPVAVLFRRAAVLRAGGWDETLRAAQDRDFMISVAIRGATFSYQPGCDSIYRRYGDVTVSTGNRGLWLLSHRAVLEKAERNLAREGRLSTVYRTALACSYFRLARQYFERDRAAYRQLMKKTLLLAPDFSPNESRLYNLTQKLLGFAGAEQMAVWSRNLRAPAFSSPLRRMRQIFL